MNMLKRKRWQSSAYLDYVRGLPCSVCGLIPIDGGANDPHHIIGRSMGGMGTKSADWSVLPLCRQHHSELHDSGVDTWERENGPQAFYALRTIGGYLERMQ